MLFEEAENRQWLPAWLLAAARHLAGSLSFDMTARDASSALHSKKVRPRLPTSPLRPLRASPCGPKG